MFANIRTKKTKRLSPYDENEIWDLDKQSLTQHILIIAKAVNI